MREVVRFLSHVAGPALVLVVACSPVAHAGGIQMSIQDPARPFKPNAREVALLVNTLECHEAKDLKLVGTAEGVVDGQRRTIPLRLTKAAGAGVYEVRQQWPARGNWVLVFSASAWGHTSSLIVQLEPNGGFQAVSEGSASGFLKVRGTLTLWNKASPAEINASLKGAPIPDSSELRRTTLLNWVAEKLGL